MFEIAIDDKKGNVWLLTGGSATNQMGIVTGMNYKTARFGSAGSLEFTLIRNALYQSKQFSYSNGDIVRVKYKDKNLFYGYIFSIDKSQEDDVKIQCYDQMRYLMNTATYAFNNMTATEILKKIGMDYGLKLGKVEETAYRIPTMLEDNKKLMDILCKALDYTLIHEKENYFIYDDFGALSLRKSDNMFLDFYIGEKSLLTSYASKISIDSDTYNKVVLYQDNKESGKRDLYVAKDSEKISKWGLLELKQSVDENMNRAQIGIMLDQLIFLRSRETKTLSVKAIGNPAVRAGCYVRIIIEELGIQEPFLVESCTHEFHDNEHTMSLELKVI